MKVLRWAAIIVAVHNLWSLLALIALVAGECFVRFVTLRFRSKEV
ncbi:MAG TPA: hypothetical protein VGF97_01415 [Rhizomicrobium sp.]|jgi:hypothetical protein